MNAITTDKENEIALKSNWPISQWLYLVVFFSYFNNKSINKSINAWIKKIDFF